MKKIICMTVILGCFSVATAVWAAEEQRQPPAPAIAAATNLAADYPRARDQLPPVPVPPASQADVKATAAYIAAVDAYLKAAQKYIDAATMMPTGLLRSATPPLRVPIRRWISITPF